MKVNQKDGLILLYGVFFLVFLQLLSDFIETIYAFGLLRTSLAGEIASRVWFGDAARIEAAPQSLVLWA